MAYNLTPLELASSKVYGPDPAVPPLAAAPPDLTTLAALEAAVLPAVTRPPCVAAFSGGRDSSLMLAIAARVAKREGLPAPVPATIRFVDIQKAEESSWQELVLRHLGIEERVSVDVRTDLDFVGPLAARVLRRHGVLWPLNIYLHEALIGYARGGSLLTGFHGDAVFGGERWRTTNDLLGRRRRPHPRDALRLGLAFSPRWLKQLVFRRRVEDVPWLRPAARAAFVEGLSRAQASAPRRWDHWIDFLASRRGFRMASESMRLLAADADTRHVEPLADRSVLACMARAGGSLGIGDRTAIMRSLFTGVLPDQLLARPDKAVFGAAFVGSWTRNFASEWQGEGVDHDLVDPEILRATWLAERFDSRAALLLQAAWLHGQRGVPRGRS
jgi:hypothetical protein